MNQETKTAIFFGAWAILGMASFLLYRSKMEAKTKRKRLILFNAFLSVIFAGFIIWTQQDILTLLVAIPFLVLVTVMNIRIMHVCSSCSAVQMDTRAALSGGGSCRKCGAALV